MIGGKLGVKGADGVRAQELLAAGFDEVVEEGGDPAAALRAFAASLPVTVTLSPGRPLARAHGAR